LSTHGKIVDCPFCFGTGNGIAGKGKCRSCDGNGKVEYTESHGVMRARPGTILPVSVRGKSGHRLCLFGESTDAVAKV